jgi:hypothetical protein
LTRSPRRPSPAARAVRRSRRPAQRQPSFLERYRTGLLWIGGIVVFIGLVYVGFIAPSTAASYECVNFFDPTPAPSFVPPSPAPVGSGATAAPQATVPSAGFVQPDMGRTHVAVGTKVKYTWCPPGSGNHYSQSGQGPIRGGFYDQNTPTIPEGWIHNLEHGALVLAYKCPGPGCTDEGQAAMQALLGRWPNSPLCKIPPGNFTPVFTKFNDMPYPYAAIVWDMVLPLQTLDEAAILAFYNAYAEEFNPENQCPNVARRGAPTPAPSSAPSASPSAAPSGTGSPGASPAASPAGS